MDEILDFSMKRVKECGSLISPAESNTSADQPTSTTNGSPKADTMSVQLSDLLRQALSNQLSLPTLPNLPNSPNLLPPPSMFTPDPSLLPTTSLALSALHRRRRRAGSCSDGNSDSGSPIKKPRAVPEENKDDSYWERRRKNNQAAKRSRDNRKSKEDEIALRAALLEQENLKLKAQVNVLKNEMGRLHCLLFNQIQS